MKRKGQSTNEEKVIKTSFDISEEKHTEFRIALIKKNISMHQFIHDKIDEFLQEVEKEDKKKRTD